MRKCPYCDFNSHPLGGKLQEQRYVDALLADLCFELTLGPIEREVQSVFLGGGTPSLFSPAVMARLLSSVSEYLTFSRDVEITMEANPGATEYADLPGYLAAGINRLSLGAQSFDTKTLESLGRIHSPGDIDLAYQRARQAGFRNINIDLMYGLPGQDDSAASMDVSRAIDLGPEHLSLYQLTLEPNTVFHRYPPELPDDEALFDIQQTVMDTAAAAGFERYEVSAYARHGHRCRHNLNYWGFGDYLGLGAGAHGKVTGASGAITRRSRKRHPGNFMSAAGTADAVAEERQVTGDDLVFEFLLNALRLKGGFTLSMAQSHTGVATEAFVRCLQPSIGRGLIRQTGETIRCTPRGYLFLDDILASILPADQPGGITPTEALEI